MKFFPSAVCGFLMVLPLTAGSAFAQSSATSSSPSASRTQSAPSAPTSHAGPTAAERSIAPLTPGAPTPPAHPITTEQTRELLDLMGYKTIEQNNWSQMIAMNKQAAPFIPNDVWTDVQSNINGIDYTALMQPIYAKYLSQEDAAKALVFYSTPEGKRVLQAMPPMLGESVAATQKKGREVGRDAIEKHRPEIEAAQKKYQEEHAPKPAPGASTPGGSTPGAASPGPGASTPAPAPSAPSSGATPSKPQR